MAGGPSNAQPPIKAAMISHASLSMIAPVASVVVVGGIALFVLRAGAEISGAQWYREGAA